MDKRFRAFTISLLAVLRSISGKRVRSNLTIAQRKGLKELKGMTSSGAIKIGVSNKGGEFVVLTQELDQAITRFHLQDATVYQQSSAQEFARHYRRLNKRWTDIARLANTPNSRLRCDLPVAPVLYTLIKTHKLPIDCVHTFTRPFSVQNQAYYQLHRWPYGPSLLVSKPGYRTTSTVHTRPPTQY